MTITIDLLGPALAAIELHQVLFVALAFAAVCWAAVR